MYDFSKRISKFHQDHVRLTNGQRADMRRRRETNLERIENGLEETNKPSIAETINQGGYAQKTMTQPPENDEESRYDIDLGVAFEEDDAAGPRTTRNWVRDAIARMATNLKNDPDTKKKCVRVVYADGYQCDFPVFRRKWSEVGWKYELSSGDEWVGSDPAAMNKWIETTVSVKSPETSGSYQLRRIIRLGKFFSKTHSSRLNRKFPGGLVATALFIEAYISAEGRDDEAFRKTLRALSNRSKYSPVYANGIQVSDDKDTDRIGRLIDLAKESVKELDKLDAEDATETDANKAWKSVFRHNFFEEETKEAVNNASAPLEKKSALGAAGLAAPFLASQAAAALPDSEKHSRMEAAVSARQESGSGGKPWSK
ncbi:cyclic GMP-AMP synthase DncV-like nucleotidyltransferase [Roseovarius sp. B08]|uniref:cyclic GMP-AMP synthase DncV-like nucleotidyltransferase n=1 Tax=Roseovarius sp. B08 TaxID=3449223 RepID=UPI003EDB830B